MTALEPREDAAPRCPGCGHTCCPYPNLECGGDSDVVAACEREDVAVAEAVRHVWHETGFYGRADLDPRWLDGLATITAEALAPLIAERVRAAAVEALRKHRCRPCGCGWCCANTPTEQRGEVHQRTCQPHRADRRAER